MIFMGYVSFREGKDDEETRNDLIPKPAHLPSSVLAIHEVLDGGGKLTIQPIASQRGKSIKVDCLA